MKTLDKFKIPDRLAVVTGGTKGIGRAISIALAEAGANIVTVSRTPAPDLEAMIIEMGRKYNHHVADLTCRAEVSATIASISEKIGAPDILINNAGICPRTACENFSDDDWDKTMEANLTACFILSRNAARSMLPKRNGKIINIASVLAFQGGLNIPAYAATKHGLAGLTKSLANAWASRGINVNAIAPGYFATAFIEGLLNDPLRSTALLSRVPAQRWGQADDIGGLAVFLASPASDFVHGAVIPVDGGWLAT